MSSASDSESAGRDVHEPIQFPELQDELVDEPKIRALLFDLEQATVRDVRLKASAEHHAEGEAVGLVQAGQRLLAGSAMGLQIDYEYGGSSWRDTLLRIGGGYRVVRVQL